LSIYDNFIVNKCLDADLGIGTDDSTANSEYFSNTRFIGCGIYRSNNKDRHKGQKEK
jgi:hypothetical protein